MDYERAQLIADENPMALVVLAAQERERLRGRGDGFNTKWYLIRRLYERGYSQGRNHSVQSLLIGSYSDDEEIRLDEENFGGGRMPYTSWTEGGGRATDALRDIG